MRNRVLFIIRDSGPARNANRAVSSGGIQRGSTDGLGARDFDRARKKRPVRGSLASGSVRRDDEFRAMVNISHVAREICRIRRLAAPDGEHLEIAVFYGRQASRQEEGK